jgi:hypothetical protein
VAEFDLVPTFGMDVGCRECLALILLCFACVIVKCAGLGEKVEREVSKSELREKSRYR